MGFSCSWIAFNSVPKLRALALAGLQDTGLVEDMPEAPFQVAELPTGWTLIYSNDVEYASSQNLAKVASDHAVLGCQVEEHAMVSVSAFYVRRQAIWQVAHESSVGLRDLKVYGSVPPEFKTIRSDLFRKQDQAGNATGGVDYIFDVPIALAASVCGYRHDRAEPEGRNLLFTIAVPVG